MPIDFENLAKKLQKKLVGGDDKHEQGAYGNHSAYSQRPSEYGYYQRAHSMPPPQRQHGHHQPEHSHPQHQHGHRLAPRPPHMSRPYPQQTAHYPQQYLQTPHPPAHQLRPMSTSPRPITSNRHNNPSPQPHSGSYGSSSARQPTFQQCPGHDRLPPGAHIDLKTGRIQANMFPPGYDGPLLQQ
ncbi:hypothetical protein K458DRAFT_391226 [Lentithecium fluviatile CBS 122367]|uniref:Uncharacterized protein n=1 Tax=Lentithecium fluviatile CBS 122367 TaxID=1168545 RepID=A0A6G1IVB4_9PLEO|nr:hypothetical protein K458DRAFT_391226 [Lentithecium fluviatile CBS 122367]